MTQWVGLVPDKRVRVELCGEPFVILDSGQVIICSNKEGSGNADLVKRDLWWVSGAVDLHVLDMAKVVAKILFSVLNALSIIDEVLVAQAGWKIFQDNIKTVKIVN